MKWIRLDNGDWQAQGKEGDFRVWKDGKVWKGRYRSKDEKKLFFLPIQNNVKKMKAVCEANFYWEDTSGGEVL